MFGFIRSLFAKRKLTHGQIIVKAMVEHPYRIFYVSDYQNGRYFVGYSAARAISTLCRKGLLEKMGHHNRFMGYTIKFGKEHLAREYLQDHNSLAHV